MMLRVAKIKINISRNLLSLMEIITVDLNL